jgi:MarR family 2-MHQ and catechol resistance regulon transcriptional repressor
MSKENLKLLISIGRVQKMVFGLIEKGLKAHKLSISEFGVLEFLLHKGSQKVQVIAQKILVTSGTITYVIDKLEKKGLVERIMDPEDKRSFLIHLTSAGKEFIQPIFDEHALFLDDLFQDLGDRKKERMTNDLFDLYTSLENNYGLGE